MEFRTPSGCRDLTGNDVRKKRYLQKVMQESFESHGFEEVMTPALEYYKTYSEAFDSLQDHEMVKLIDENSEILAMRLDMTVPIARVAASKYSEKDLPLRFSYCSNVYKTRKSFAGKRMEVMDCGVELIGNNPGADLELLCTALDTLRALPIENYTFEIGEARFFQAAADAVFESREDIRLLADLIHRKSLVELDDFLKSRKMDPEIRTFFAMLPWLNGDVSVLAEARKLAFLPELEEVIDNLEMTWAALKQLGYEESISFDLGKIPYLNYYTGMIFEAFADGVGTSILSGGRYDNLLQKFGLQSAARGFSVKLDYLIDLFELEDDRPCCRLFYPAGRMLEAFALAAELRKEGTVILQEWDRDEIVKELEV